MRDYQDFLISKYAVPIVVKSSLYLALIVHKPPVKVTFKEMLDIIK